MKIQWMIQGTRRFRSQEGANSRAIGVHPRSSADNAFQ
jgi:hypothetical protein